MSTLLNKKTQEILNVIFDKDAETTTSVTVYENVKANIGKIYLPLDVSLQALKNKALSFNVKVFIRQDKTVIQY